jgi:murein DD-endopeptidase MepM/ murein hydrolase activator NlpD
MEKNSVSPLYSAMNNIVKINTSFSEMNKTKKSYTDFSSFIQRELVSIKSIEIPEKEKIKRLQSIEIGNVLGRPANLLSGLVSGALDVGSLFSNFLGKGKKGKTPLTSPGKPPKVKGTSLKLGGFKALGIANALFAGLDFATGLAEGESAGKAAAGAGGALAGSLLGGAIGQALIPVPGLGFVIGSMAGNFLGGFLGDRAHEVVTKEDDVKKKTKERLKKQEEAQRARSISSGTPFSSVLDKFDSVVYKLEGFAMSTARSAAAAAGVESEIPLDYGLNPDSIPDAPSLPGELPDMKAEGGQLPSKFLSSPYGWRWGKMHRGVDYATTSGTPISVIQPGTISQAGWIDGYGYSVTVAHPGGSASFYAHMSKIAVKNGQAVEPGTILGNVGSTGRSTGPHVHFEILQGGKPVQIPSNEGDKYFRFGGNVKVSPRQSSGSPSAGLASAGGLVIASGTNDYSDPDKVYRDTVEQIKSARKRGYDPVVVPPNSKDPEFKAAHDAVIRAAKELGARVEVGEYGTGDRDSRMHLTMQSAQSIRARNKGAMVVGDSNASRIAGRNGAPGVATADSSGGSMVSGSGRNTLDFINKLPQRSVGGGLEVPDYIVPTENLTNTQKITSTGMESYARYNMPTMQSQSVIMPIMMGGGSQKVNSMPQMSGGGSHQSSEMISPPPDGKILNRLLTSILLTNLSSS